MSCNTLIWWFQNILGYILAVNAVRLTEISSYAVTYSCMEEPHKENDVTAVRCIYLIAKSIDSSKVLESSSTQTSVQFQFGVFVSCNPIKSTSIKQI